MIARFISQTHSECDECDKDIEAHDQMGYDKVSHQYLCEDCIDARWWEYLVEEVKSFDR